MKIDSTLVKKLRTAENLSQEHLSEKSGLSLRTIQRLENGSNASIESVRALAAAFGIDPTELMLSGSEARQTPLEAIETGLREFGNFSGTTTRYEFWWFLAFVVVITAVATLLHERAAQIAGVILLLPLLAASNRRLNDAGHSPWWQMFWFVPFGQIVILILLAQPTTEQPNPQSTGKFETP
jgi:transcriptional regulator with XRE-family HTH domain